MREDETSSSTIPEVAVKKRGRISIVWLIPLVAAAIGGWLAYKSYTERGVTITIAFDTADGIDAGKTKIKYKSVEVGHVEGVVLSDDLSQVIVTATIVRGSRGSLTDKSKFWVVRPRIGAGGISGLGTLVSGAYIALEPAAGKPARKFVGLSEPPLLKVDAQGLKILLKSKTLGSLSIGSPVYYREIRVGEVVGHDLATIGEEVRIHAWVDAPHHQLVRDNSRFWNASGIGVSVGFDGVSVKTGSLAALLEGGVAFDSPATPEPGKPAVDGATYELHPSFASLPKIRPAGLDVVLQAETLGSINVGSPVFFRDVRVGEVTAHELRADDRGVDIHLSVHDPYSKLVRSQSRFWNASGVDVSVGGGGVTVSTESLEAIVLGGIAFDTPGGTTWGTAAEHGAPFKLYATRASLPKSTHNTLDFILEARQAALSPGAPVYYRAVEVGYVGVRALSQDAKAVRFHVHIERRYASLVRQNTKFWNASGIGVNVGVGGVDVRTESLAAIIAGGVAFATPDRLGKRAEAGALFALHDSPKSEWLKWTPTVWLGDPQHPERIVHAISSGPPAGLDLVLEAFKVGSVGPGAPIYYREVKVGEVLGNELAKDATTVRIKIRIYDRHKSLVRNHSKFWNASGISAHLGLHGLDVQTESVTALLTGGVAFATPDPPGETVAPGTLFPLHQTAKNEWLEWAPVIWLGPRPASGELQHALYEKQDAHLLYGHKYRVVERDSVAPEEDDATTEPALQPIGQSAGSEEDSTAKKKKPNFFKRIFHRDDKD